jgi:hypothetical protein
MSFHRAQADLVGAPSRVRRTCTEQLVVKDKDIRLEVSWLLYNRDQPPSNQEPAGQFTEPDNLTLTGQMMRVFRMAGVRFKAPHA